MLKVAQQPNPFYAAHETSLSKLSDHDWRILNSRFLRGIDWYVEKIGSRWYPSEAFGNWPPFRTKRAAGEAAENLVMAEVRHRAKLQWNAEH